MENCVICCESDGSLVQCKDAESWARLYRAAAIKQHHQILDLSTGEQDFPKFHVKYHASCRKGFVNQKSLEILTRKSTESIETGKDQSQLRRSSRDLQGSSGNRQCCKTHVYFVIKENISREQEHGRNCVASKHLERMKW